MQRRVLMGKPVLLGRSAKGKAFAMLDVCPHQGIPLSDGWFDGHEVTCRFHGWTFGCEGACSGIPSLTEDQQFDVTRIRVKTFPCEEAHDVVWVYLGDTDLPLPPLPEVPGIAGNRYFTTINRLTLPSHIDYGVVALMDPAHVAYVHSSWWFRSTQTIRDKVKHFIPSALGYTMVSHTPAAKSLVYRLLGGMPTTEIRFLLPGIRIEHMRIGEQSVFTSLTCLTPVDEKTTQMLNTMYWCLPVLQWLAPLARPFISLVSQRFLEQDRDIAAMQQVGLATNPDLIVVMKDAGMPVKWYYDLKEEWRSSRAERREFTNPVREQTLRWRS